MLPVAAAKLLLLGHPFELMDGDAAHVPIKWVTAVLNELKNILHNATLLTVSVLGIQSSGKSTLLNTMFGLRFAVSAGRCTKGIFAQIVPVDKSEQSHGFDYALIIDTEGLRAPELAQGKTIHDNELATFVVGLADVVLINIKGETLADMENVLQIVVHGLLRLKQANKKLDLHQSCILIHQNVTAEDAQKQLVQGNKKIVEKLDTITKEVALQEGISQTSFFRDVIKFDPINNVIFLPDLWKGSGPMSPVNPNYSSKSLGILRGILDLVRDRKCMVLEDIILNIQSLWNGVLNENFVFSFRNYLELKAYSVLETEYQSQVAQFEDMTLQWILDNIKPRLWKQNDSLQVTAEADKLKTEFHKRNEQKKLEIEKQLIEFIEKSQLAETMMQWKHNRLLSLKQLAKHMMENVQGKIKRAEKERIFTLSTEDLLSKKEKEVISMAREVALENQNKDLTQESINDEFKTFWKRWIKGNVPEFSEESIESRNKSLQSDMRIILDDIFESQNPLISKGVGKLYSSGLKDLSQLKGSIKEIKDSNIKKKNWYSIMSMTKAKKDKKAIICYIDLLFEEIDTQFDSLFNQETDYDISLFKQIIYKVKKAFNSYNGDRAHCFSLTPKFEVFVAIHVARHCLQKFKSLIRTYEEKHGLNHRLEKVKEQAKQLFSDTCRAQSQEIIAINLLCVKFEQLIKERVQTTIPLKMKSYIVDMFCNQKRSILKSILEELAIENNFAAYVRYIRNPSYYVLCWIKDKTDDVVFSKKKCHASKYYEWAKSDIEYLVEAMQEHVKSASRHSVENCSGIGPWKNDLVKLMGPLGLLIEKGTFQHITVSNIASFTDFGNNVIKGLKERVKINLIKDFKSHKSSTILWPEQAPYEAIFESLWGCEELCPFCKEPCQKALRDHLSSNDCHTCIQHRPGGIGGIHERESKKLRIESCNFEVQSEREIYCGAWCKCPQPVDCEDKHKYRNYRTYRSDWDISPSPDTSLSIYWNWFMCNHVEDLAQYYELKSPEIPTSWKNITQEMAIQSLSDIYC